MTGSLEERWAGLTHDEVRALAAVVRAADEQHEVEGGGTRHWVRDYFLPRLEVAGWTIKAPDVHMIEGTGRMTEAVSSGDPVTDTIDTLLRERDEALAEAGRLRDVADDAYRSLHAGRTAEAMEYLRGMRRAR